MKYPSLFFTFTHYFVVFFFTFSAILFFLRYRLAKFISLSSVQSSHEQQKKSKTKSKCATHFIEYALFTPPWNDFHSIGIPSSAQMIRVLRINWLCRNAVCSVNIISLHKFGDWAFYKQFICTTSHICTVMR